VPYDIDATYAQIRDEVFAWKDERAPKGSPCGVVMETGYPKAIFTLVALSDGTVNLYYSTGGGMLGAGAHDGPANAAMMLAQAAKHFAPQLPVVTNKLPPVHGETKIYVLVDGQVRGVAAPEREFGENRRPQSAMYQAGQRVIAEIGKLPMPMK
jgi:hypothetical protein